MKWTPFFSALAAACLLCNFGFAEPTVPKMSHAELNRKFDLLLKVAFAMAEKRDYKLTQKQTVETCAEAIRLVVGPVEEGQKLYLGRRCVLESGSFYALWPSERFQIMDKLLIERITNQRWFARCVAAEITPIAKKAGKSDSELLAVANDYAVYMYHERGRGLDLEQIDLVAVANAALADFPDDEFAMSMSAFGRCLEKPIGEISRSLK